MRFTTKNKLAAVSAFGGKCQRCGYSKCTRALHFHHKDPSEKPHNERRRWSVTSAEVIEYPERFELLCANCHYEVHEEIDRVNSIYRTCVQCGKQFKAEPARIAEGRDKYCSQKCKVAMQRLSGKPTQEKFWRHVNKTDACWFWTAHVDKNGYGRINDGGKPRLVHRISWEIHKGAIPQDIEVLHSCENPNCVNPEHLFIGDANARAKEASRKGNTARGERSGHNKLTETDVDEIRRLYHDGDASQAKIAQKFNVSHATVSEIVRCLTWSHPDTSPSAPK